MKQHTFELKVANPPRTWTRQQWREVSRYLRTCRRRIEEELGLTVDDKATCQKWLDILSQHVRHADLV